MWLILRRGSYSYALYLRDCRSLPVRPFMNTAQHSMVPTSSLLSCPLAAQCRGGSLSRCEAFRSHTLSTLWTGSEGTVCACRPRTSAKPEESSSVPARTIDPAQVTSVSSRIPVTVREAGLVHSRARKPVQQERDSTWYTIQP